MKKPRFMRVKYDGRGMIRFAAFLLLVLCGYELYVRLDDFTRWTDAIRILSERTGGSFYEYMRIILDTPSMTGMKNILIFLLSCVVLALLCLIFSNKPWGASVLIPTDAGVLCLGLFLPYVTAFGFSGLLQIIKLFPIALILVGCIVNIVEKGIQSRYMKMHPETQQGISQKPGMPGHLPQFREGGPRAFH